MISLCMIVGNVEDYIERCLKSFAPIADEICIVRAIGNQKPDRTCDLALEFGLKAKIPVTLGEYLNKPGHKDWPHVDDFAAARQLSFDIATGDYCFWCDSDDVLKAGADQIRQHARAGGYACFIFQYDIFGKNVVLPRERMMLREAGAWRYPVHECFKFKLEPATSAWDEGVIIQHLPALDKGDKEIAKGQATGNQRNLRILESIPPEELTAGLKFHLFGELICSGRKQEAVDLAVELITGNELGKDERYDLLLSLVLQTEDLERKVDLLHEAHKADPERREALGVLSGVMLDLQRPIAALAYARQMAATTEPEIHAWNSRQSFYGYTGDDIYQQALRANGRWREAEIVRRESLQRHGGPKIALLHATRGRPHQASKCRKAWHDLATHPGQIEHIFAIDDDDRESDVLRRFHHCTVPPGGGCVAAWNAAAASTAAPVLVQLSDDWIPMPKWDELILQRLGDLSAPKVLAIHDGHRTDDLLCMAICTRSYWCLDYFLFHPWFKGVYSDNWFTELAYRRGLVVPAKDMVFRHNHPAFTGQPMDATYARQNAPELYAEGEKLWDYLRAGNDWSSVPGFYNYFDFYRAVAMTLKDGDAVAEIGVWLGRSIICLAQLLQRMGKKVRLYAVDHFKGESNQVEHEATVAACGGNLRSSFEANIKRCGVADMITILDGHSWEMAANVPDGSLAFCYVDAAHDYDSVKRDILAWTPKVRPGGVLAGHDAQCADVMKAVKELVPTAQVMGPVWMKRLQNH